MRRAHLEQLVGPLTKLGDAQGELLGIDQVLVALIAQRERVLENPSRGMQDTRLPRDRVGDQLPGPPEQ